MDKAKGVVKGGWHPKGKDGGKESWRGDFKGINQVAGWVGKGKDSNASVAQEHTSRPLQALKDPSAFGPPPKNVNYHGGAAVPNAITPDHRGLGAPLSEDEVHATRQQEEEAAAAAKKPAPPPVPYRVDRTGLNTSNLPPPPTRAANPSEAEVQSPATKPKPRLPPRLPPRQNSHPGETTPAPPPPYSAAIEQPQQQQPQPSQSSFLNQAASSRLGSAGIKVPGLGIGGSSSPSPTAAPQAQSPSVAPNQEPNNPWRDQPSSSSPSTISGLTNRFGSLRTAAATSPDPSAKQPTSTSASPSGGGTTVAQKQAALKTAQSFRNDPGSVSMADARATASTAKNFNDRHGEQVASGWKAGNKLNQKYGIANKVGGYAGQSQPSAAEGGQETGANSRAGAGGGGGGGGSFGSAAAALGGFKKAPPPPPPAARGNTGGSLASPPPVPLGSKPR